MLFQNIIFELLFQVNIRLLHMQGCVFLFILMKAVWSGSWKDLKAMIAEGGRVTLDTDYIADNGGSEEDGILIVPGGKSGVLDLKGHVIDRSRQNKREACHQRQSQVRL